MQSYSRWHGDRMAQYSENVQELEYAIKVPFVNQNTSTKRVQWVDINISGKYFRDAIDIWNGNTISITYYFKDKEDAVAFKMRWG